VTVEQLPVFGGVEAHVVERVAFETTDAFAVGGPACEHQSRARRSMSPKTRKHAPLTVMIQVEEASQARTPSKGCLSANARISEINASWPGDALGTLRSWSLTLDNL
jgi:hypothetical protein